MASHAECTHPATKVERTKCRKRNRHYSPSQAECVESWRETWAKPPVELDAELKGWVLDFIRDHPARRVTAEEVGREFFPDEPDTAASYLAALKSSGAIRQHRETGAYGYVPPKFRPNPSPVTVTPKQTRRNSHDGCVHPDTPRERKKCWGGYYIHGTMERAPSVADIIRSIQPKPAPKLKGVPKPKAEPKPKLTPEEAEARRKQWNGKGRLTVSVLAGQIYKRMGYNRHRQYVFTREWIHRQDPGVPPEMVDKALQHLVDAGRISALPS